MLRAPPIATNRPMATARVVDKKCSIRIPIPIAPDQHLNPGAPNSWQVSGADQAGNSFVERLDMFSKTGRVTIVPKDATKNFQDVVVELNWPGNLQPSQVTLTISMDIGFCLDSDEGCLPPKKFSITQPLDLQ